MSCLRAAGERSEHPSHVAHFLGIEHLVENRENAPLFLSYSHGGHPFRMPPYLQWSHSPRDTATSSRPAGSPSSR